MDGRPRLPSRLMTQLVKSAVHCGNGFAAGFGPYHSTGLSRYNAASELGCGNAATRVHYASRRRGDRMAARGARAAGGDAVRRIGFLVPCPTDGQSCRAALCSGCNEFGWTEGRTIAFDYRWAERHRSAVRESQPISSD